MRNQSSMFSFEQPVSDTSEQQTLWNNLPSIEQWHTVWGLLRARNFESNQENAVGFWGEAITHTMLWPLAAVGGFIEYQKVIGRDTRADFFIKGLSLYPKGVAIETRVQTGRGSHDGKLITTMVNYRSLGYPARLLIVGDVISDKNRRLMRELQGVDVMPYDMVGFLEWVLLTKKAQLLNYPNQSD